MVLSLFYKLGYAVITKLNVLLLWVVCVIETQEPVIFVNDHVVLQVSVIFLLSEFSWLLNINDNLLLYLWNSKNYFCI